MSDKSQNQNEEKLEAIAKVRMLKTSPQKLNLVSKMIRNKPVNVALAQLKFSRKRIALEVKKCLESAVANAENNHDLDPIHKRILWMASTFLLFVLPSVPRAPPSSLSC